MILLHFLLLTRIITLISSSHHRLRLNCTQPATHEGMRQVTRQNPGIKCFTANICKKGKTCKLHVKHDHPGKYHSIGYWDQYLYSKIHVVHCETMTSKTKVYERHLRDKIHQVCYGFFCINILHINYYNSYHISYANNLKLWL